MKKIIAAVFIILLLFALVFDTKNMTDSIRSSVETCLYTIIPALFGFMAISSYLIKSGLFRILFKPVYLLLRHIIKLSEEEFGIFLLSLFGGYPIGAKLLADNTKMRTESAPLLAFCYCPSPGFVISVVGLGLFSNPQAGLLVYFSNVLACVLIAIILNFKRKNITTAHGNPPLRLNAFTPAVLSASSALFPVCAVVVAFGLIKGALQFIGIQHLLGEAASAYIFAALEITGTSSLAPNPALLPLIAALFSTGGLCILMQIPALFNDKIPLRGFFLWRIPAAILSALFCRLLMPFIDFTAYISVSTGGVSALPTEAGSPIASVCLLIMAVILVRTVGEERLDTE
jgi:hypothetical protein